MVSKGCGRPARFVTRSTNSDGIESLCTSYSPPFATTAPSPYQTILAHQAGRRASFSLDENMGGACTKVWPSGYCNISILYTINEEKCNSTPPVSLEAEVAGPHLNSVRG